MCWFKNKKKNKPQSIEVPLTKEEYLLLMSAKEEAAKKAAYEQEERTVVIVLSSIKNDDIVNSTSKYCSYSGIPTLSTLRKVKMALEKRYPYLTFTVYKPHPNCAMQVSWKQKEEDPQDESALDSFPTEVREVVDYYLENGYNDQVEEQLQKLTKQGKVLGYEHNDSLGLALCVYDVHKQQKMMHIWKGY